MFCISMHAVLVVYGASVSARVVYVCVCGVSVYLCVCVCVCVCGVCVHSDVSTVCL